MLVFNHSIDTFKLIVIDCDMFHLLSWFGTWQGDELFLEKTSKFTMYFWEVLGFCRESLQVPSAFIFSSFHIACENIRFSSLFAAGDVSEKRMFSQAMFHTPREILDGLSWVSLM